MTWFALTSRRSFCRRAAGRSRLLGDGLHIARLHLEEGQLIVEGDITGIEYGQPQAQAARGGFFSRMFR